MRHSLGLICATLVALLCLGRTRAQCPWQRDVPDLQTACLCAYNLGHEISVQCDQADFPTLLSALNTFTKAKPIDLLYVNNSTVDRLEADVFLHLRLHNVQLSNCNIHTIEAGAFRGQEKYLKNLNLQENLLTAVPDTALKPLEVLNLLDLSKNRIETIPEDTFAGLDKLSTLKLSDNNVTLARFALRGLEATLKNLNLRGTKQKRVPEAIRFMKSLAFLDLSQNGIRELPGPGGIHTFEGLDSLSALNLERNLIQTLGETAFQGVRKTLSSLSLLNNLLAEFPVGAVHLLKELRVLDIGFNLLTALPETAFRGNPGITLLALDGNPLQNVPERALAHLNKTLRGLSLGGRFLHCDCKLKWVAEWVRNGDLQVTSRERNPQFCGSPNRFRDRGFYSIQPEEFTCPESEIDLDGPIGVVDSLIPKSQRPTAITTVAASSSPPSATTLTVTTTTTTSKPTTLPGVTATLPSTKAPATTTTTTGASTPIVENTTNQVASNLVTTDPPSHLANTIPPHSKPPQGHSHLWRQQQQPLTPSKQRPSLIKGPPSTYHKSKLDAANEVQVKHAFRQDSAVIIQWDSETSNILGFRVVYRLFGDKSFKQGPPLEASEREFKIKNVPAQECIVVCVVSLEDINVTPENVNYHQCREVRTVASAASNMDKITIAASAAICGTIIVSVIVFIAASRRRSRKLQSLHSPQKSPLPIGGLPIVNCCGPAASPGGPLGSLATLSAYNTHKEWDQVSAYSNRSIPRPRIYATDNHSNHHHHHQGIADDLRSHISHFSGLVATKPGKARSIADGQSQHSVSNHSHRGYLNSAFPTNLVNSRPELRQSRQSLAAVSDRMSRASYAASIHGGGGGGAASIASSTRRARPRSRSRDYLSGSHVHNNNRSIGRFSQHGSQHNLNNNNNNNNNYCDTSDNWTDHDMDIYMARNSTARNGMGPI